MFSTVQAVERKDCGEGIREILMLTLTGAISGLSAHGALRPQPHARSRRRRARRSPSTDRRASRSRSPPARQGRETPPGLSPPSPEVEMGGSDDEDPVTAAMNIATRAMQRASVGRVAMGLNISPSDLMRNLN